MPINKNCRGDQEKEKTFGVFVFFTDKKVQFIFLCSSKAAINVKFTKISARINATTGDMESPVRHKFVRKSYADIFLQRELSLLYLPPKKLAAGITDIFKPDNVQASAHKQRVKPR